MPRSDVVAVGANHDARLPRPGAAIVREGQPGDSMYFIAEGEVEVRAKTARIRLKAGAFFGERALVIGAPRNATVRALVDSELLEITTDAFRRFVMAIPTAVEDIGVAVANRRAELEQHRATGSAPVQAEPPRTLINRIRLFLGLDR